MTQTGYGQPQEEVHDPPLLFDLGVDPGESRNVAAEQTEVLTEIHAAVMNHREKLIPAESQLQ